MGEGFADFAVADNEVVVGVGVEVEEVQDDLGDEGPANGEDAGAEMAGRLAGGEADEIGRAHV